MQEHSRFGGEVPRQQDCMTESQLRICYYFNAQIRATRTMLSKTIAHIGVSFNSPRSFLHYRRNWTEIDSQCVGLPSQLGIPESSNTNQSLFDGALQDSEVACPSLDDGPATASAVVGE